MGDWRYGWVHRSRYFKIVNVVGSHLTQFKSRRDYFHGKKTFYVFKGKSMSGEGEKNSSLDFLHTRICT